MAQDCPRITMNLSTVFAAILMAWGCRNNDKVEPSKLETTNSEYSEKVETPKKPGLRYSVWVVRNPAPDSWRPSFSMTLRHLRDLDFVRYITEGVNKGYLMKDGMVLDVRDALEKLVENMRAKGV